MKRNRKLIQISVLAVIFIISAFTIGNSLYKPNTSVKVGSKAPDFKLADLEKQIHELANYEGKALVINFWGTFCPPCVDEMPALQNQYDQWKDKNVIILGINLSESQITVKGFLDQNAITFPIVIDNNDVIRKKYQVTSYPTTFFVDSSGVIQEKFVGGMNELIISSRIDKLIKNDSRLE